MTTHTIPGELFLLLTNDAGRQDSTSYRRQALAAAAVSELALREKVGFGEERAPRIRVLDTEPTDLPVLDQALGALTELDEQPLESVLAHRSMDLTEVIGEGYAAAGAVTRKNGWFTTTWPVQDGTLESTLRARLAAALEQPARASLQDGILLELLRTLGIAHRILRDDLPHLDRRGLDRRIEQLEFDHPAAAAVTRLMNDMTAVTVGTMAATGVVLGS